MKGMADEAIFVLRHGEREDYVDPNWKSKHPDCASDDPPLAQKGHVQAKEVAHRLANEEIDYIFTSPYLRCVETAIYVADARKKSICIEPGICEVLWSTPGYKSASELQKRFPSIDLAYKPALIPQYPESCDNDCIRRSDPCAREIRQRYQGHRLLFIGHGASTAGILKAFTGRATYVGLCTLSKLVNTGTSASPVWTVQCIGDSSHLSDKTNLRAY